MRIKDAAALAGFVICAQAAGIVGSFFTISAINEWYAFLLKPDIAPPNWVFGPVWTTLFLLMGVAAYMVWRNSAATRDARVALSIFVVQLALNTLWSLIFFGQKNLGGALIEIIFLWIAIAATVWSFSRVSKMAALLLVPYIAWVSFAAYLNYLIWTLN